MGTVKMVWKQIATPPGSHSCDSSRNWACIHLIWVLCSDSVTWICDGTVGDGYEFSLDDTCNKCVHSLSHKVSWEQVSPTAWTQKAYCPPRSKYSLSCPILGGYPIPGQGVPHPEVPLPGMGYRPMEGTWDQSLGYPPQKGHGTSGSIMRWRWGIPLRLDVNWNYYLPHPSDVGGKKGESFFWGGGG